MNNRELKFRVWVDDEKRFRYCEYIPTMGFVWSITKNIKESKAADLSFIEIGENYPQQYTGLKDCEGKEIYNGDIVKCWFTGRQDKENVGVVEFCKKYGHFGVKITTNKIHVNAIHISKPFSNFITNDSKLLVKVIGNIHSNSNMLK